MIPFWYTIPAIIAIMSGESIFFCGNLRRFHKYMGFTFIFEGLLIMLTGIMHAKIDSFYLPVYALFSLMMLLSPIFYYFAIRCVASQSGIDKRDFFVFAIPAMFMLSLFVISGQISSIDKNFFYAIEYGSLPMPRRLETGAAIMLSLEDTLYIVSITAQIAVQIYCFVSLRNYGKMLERYYSDTKDKSLGILTLIFCLMLVRMIVIFCLGFIPEISDNLTFKIIQTVGLSLFYILLAIFIFRIRFTAEELGKAISNQENKLQAPVADELICAKMNLLLEEKFFTDPSTNLIDLAARIQINTKYLTEYLRFHYNETFLSYVNRLRIEYAAGLIEEGKMTLTDISETSGFTSPSTFYRNFTKIKGVSPSEYKKK